MLIVCDIYFDLVNMDPNSSNRQNSKGKTWPRGICAFVADENWVNTKPNMRKMDWVRVCPIDQIDQNIILP